MNNNDSNTVQEENENVKDDVTVGPREYKELLENFDKLDTLTKRLVLALSSNLSLSMSTSS